MKFLFHRKAIVEAVIMHARSILVFLPILIFFSLAPDALASKKITIAVSDFAGQGIDTLTGTKISDRLRSQLLKTGATVLDRSQMQEILKEQGFQQSSCTSDKCAIEAGQLLQVDYIVIELIELVGHTYSISSRLIDMSTGKVAAIANADCKCEIDDSVATSAAEIAGKLMRSLAAEQDNEPAKPAVVEKPAAPVVASGLLQIVSSPAGASLFVNDSAKGITPSSLDSLEPGTYRLRLVLRGYDSIVDSVQTVAGGNETKNYTLKTAPVVPQHVTAEKARSQMQPKIITGSGDQMAMISLLCDALAQPVDTRTSHRLAVLPFTDNTGGKDKNLGSTVAECVISSMQKKSSFVLVEREQFKKAMAEIALSQSGAISDSLALEAGKFLSANYLCTGSISTVMGNDVITARVIATESGQIVSSASISLTPSSVKDISKALIGEKASVGGAMFRSMVLPGWGQFYTDHPVRGTIWLVALVGAVGATVYFDMQMNTAKTQWTQAEAQFASFNSMPDKVPTLTAHAKPGEPLDTTYLRLYGQLNNNAQNKYNTYSNMYDYVLYSGIGIGAVWVLNLIDASIAGAQSKARFQPYFSVSPKQGSNFGLAMSF
jgi:TolB-like protein